MVGSLVQVFQSGCHQFARSRNIVDTHTKWPPIRLESLNGWLASDDWVTSVVVSVNHSYTTCTDWWWPKQNRFTPFENVPCKNKIEARGKLAKFDSENLSHVKYTLQRIWIDLKSDPWDLSFGEIRWSAEKSHVWLQSNMQNLSSILKEQVDFFVYAVNFPSKVAVLWFILTCFFLMCTFKTDFVNMMYVSQVLANRMKLTRNLIIIIYIPSTWLLRIARSCRQKGSCFRLVTLICAYSTSIPVENTNHRNGLVSFHIWKSRHIHLINHNSNAVPERTLLCKD